AFTIPILELIGDPQRPHLPQALILVPTRELAVQVRGEVIKLSHGRKARCVALYGGKPIRGQIDKLQRGADVVVGTPGRVLDHMARGTLRFDQLKIVVLDEADRMLDIGFRPDIEKILRRCPQSRQTLLLSATVPPPIERLAKRYMRDPEMLNFSSQDMSVDTIEQFYFTVDPQRKFELLKLLLKREDPTQAIVFCRTKRGTDKVHQRLSKRMKGVACIHGDMPQRSRDRTMSDFREGKQKVLIATDVVGRGIDVSGISHIINYDLPQSCDDYVHRVGRTGRMGREGVAYSFVTPEEGNELTRIEIRINRLLTRSEIEGFDTRAPVARDVVADASAPAAASPEGAAPAEPAPEKPPAHTMANSRRKRYRRAL
ncbi:MAG: DEAD/DEAH box helicase, partial [Planctomycetales bacterium]|nr:DEAD/DEAH box helicase [Planctomycetales bacterium]